jgi:hypothetical protein
MSVLYTYVFFYVKDYSGNFTLSSYTLPNTPLEFIPDFTSTPILTSQNAISNKIVRWDFGDGTYANGLTAKHQYKWPGEYDVRLTVYDKNGMSYDSTYRPRITILNFIHDQYQFRDFDKFIYDLPAGKLGDPIYIDRLNSWQSYSSLSASEYTILLYASGALGDFQNEENFYKDKWSHLRSLSRFYRINSIQGNEEYILIDKIKTSNTEIYTRIFNNKLQICKKEDEGSVFAGTSGSCEFYYADDRVKNYSGRDQPIFLYGILDNSKLNDKYTTYNNSYEYVQYPPYGYNNLRPSVYPIVKIRHNPAEYLSISTTGIIGEGTLSTTKFNIPEISWQNTEIPFVIRLKDVNNFTTKSYPPLSSSTIDTNISYLTSFDVKFDLVTQNGTTFKRLSTVNFYQDFSTDTPQSIGAFYKGYFIPNSSTVNAKLTASVTIVDPPNYTKDSILGWIAAPQYNQLVRFFNRQIYTNCPGVLTMTLTSVQSFIYNYENRNVYAIQVAPSGSGGFMGDYHTWFADGSKDTLFKLDARGVILSSFSFSNYPILSGNKLTYRNLLSPVLSSAAPGSIALDGNSDLWVALFDSVSCIKIDRNTGGVKAVAYPNTSNFVYYLSSDYNINALKGYAGENLLLPSSIDTDFDNNIWVTYTHPVSNFLVKYDTNGSVLKVINFPALITPVEAVVDRDKNVWVTAYNYDVNLSGPVTSLTGREDFLYKFDSNGILHPNFPIGGFNFIGNLTFDSKQNAWIIQDRETVTLIGADGVKVDNYIAGTGNYTNYIGSIGGIAIDTSDYIWIINNFTNKLYMIDTLTPPPTSENLVKYEPLYFPEDSIENPSLTFEDKQFQAYGDWLGTRWINKYMGSSTKVRTITGESNLFNIFSDKGKYNINKVNENFNANEFYNSLIFTENLEDKLILFNDFIGTIVGGASAMPYELGKTVYEKIANFVENVSDIDKTNIDQLISFCDELTIQFEQYNYPYPPQLKRLVNILSIKHKNLWGEINQYSNNFYKPGTGIYSEVPSNLGTQLSTLTSVISSGVPIVAQEIFSDIYTLVNQNNIVGYTLGQEIKLSGYNYDWGWGLIAPRSLSGIKISNYYNFFSFNLEYEGSYYNNIIDWDNILTTLSFKNSSFDEWRRDSGIMQTILSYELTKGLRLFLSGSNIIYNN